MCRPLSGRRWNIFVVQRHLFECLPPEKFRTAELRNCAKTCDPTISICDLNTKNILLTNNNRI